MTETPDMAEVDKILAEVEEKRALYSRVHAEVEADATIDIDDSLVEICRRLDIPLVVSGIHNDGMGMSWCGVCGVSVVRDRRHTEWHERIQAATKLSYWLAELSFKHAALLGMTLALTLDVLREAVDEEDGSET